MEELPLADQVVADSMKGQTLLEVLIALSVATIVIAAIASVILSSLNNSQYSKNKNLSAQFAQEGMEIVRQKKGSLSDGIYCMGSDGNLNISSCDSPNVEPIFVRKVDISSSANCGTYGGKGGILAKVTVKWSDSKCSGSNIYCNGSELISCFANTTLLPTP